LSATFIIKNKGKYRLKGEVVRIESSRGSEKYLWVRHTWETPDLCKGIESPDDKIQTGDHIELRGIWKKGPDSVYKHHGSYFNFYTYSILPPPIIGQSPSKALPVSQADPFEKTHSFMRDIGNVPVTYKPHKPEDENTIAWHARRQLIDRVIQASPMEKDLYFLTAFFDRSALDADVQFFRKNNPHFKEILLQCWQEADEILTKATGDIKNALNNFEIESPTFKELSYHAPGRFKRNQILICLKIINEIYERKHGKTILDIIGSHSQERRLRDYLIKLHGVGYKIANWSLTNVTGHWFVIDKHIASAINTYLKTTVTGLKINADTSDQIFKNWFGIFDENRKCYSQLSQENFISVFPDFSPNECEYLPFIVTQYLWFYGKFYREKSM